MPVLTAVVATLSCGPRSATVLSSGRLVMYSMGKLPIDPISLMSLVLSVSRIADGVPTTPACSAPPSRPSTIGPGPPSSRYSAVVFRRRPAACRMFFEQALLLHEDHRQIGQAALVADGDRCVVVLRQSTMAEQRQPYCAHSAYSGAELAMKCVHAASSSHSNSVRNLKVPAGRAVGPFASPAHFLSFRSQRPTILSRPRPRGANPHAA